MSSDKQPINISSGPGIAGICVIGHGKTPSEEMIKSLNNRGYVIVSPEELRKRYIAGCDPVNIVEANINIIKRPEPPILKTISIFSPPLSRAERRKNERDSKRSFTGRAGKV